MTTQHAHPIIIHMGKKTRRQLKRLKNGSGSLVTPTTDRLKSAGDQVGDDQEPFHMIVTYRRKRKKKSKDKGGGRGLFNM